MNLADLVAAARSGKTTLYAAPNWKDCYTVLADIRRHLDALAVHVPYLPNTLKCRIDFPNGGTIILMRLDEPSDFEKLRGLELGATNDWAQNFAEVRARMRA